MNYDDIYSRFGFYASINPKMKEDAIAVDKWLDTQFERDEQEREELKALIYEYLSDKKAKEVTRSTNAMFTRTYHDRAETATLHAKSLILSLTEALTTPKGRELSLALFALIETPEEYITDTRMTSASLDDIKSFFKKVSISKDSKEELFSILKK